VRALTRGLKLTVVEPTGSPSWNGDIDFAAMVPMQVYNLLQTPEGRERLMAVKHLIIGGGAVDEELASALASFPNAVWSTYGMTETLSHIALRRLNGPEASDWYTPFEGVTLSQTDEGCLVIDAPAVHDGALITNDIVEFDTTPGISSPPPYGESLPFRILGRKDNVICSGGVKIQAEEVERLLRARLREPYLISKRPDPKFGEAVVLLTTSTDVEAVRTVCQEVLPKYWQPRYIVHVNQIPLTETGKPARKEAERLAV